MPEGNGRSAGSASATSAGDAAAKPSERKAEVQARPAVEEQEAAQPPGRTGTSDLGPGTLDRLLGVPSGSNWTFYGWIQNSYTGNTTGTPRNRSNFDVFPDRRANDWEGNQYYLVAERPVKTDDWVDLGFRFDGFLGNDWQFSKSYGLFDRAFNPGQFTGIDLPQIYGEIHLPILVPGGVQIRGGRFYSPAGYESVMATQRPLLSVANAMNFTPFTLFGMLATIRLNERLVVQSGAVNGWDRWIDRNYRYNYVGGFTWTSSDERTYFKPYVVVGPNQLPRFAPANSPFLPTGVITSPTLQRRVDPLYPTHIRTYMSNVVSHKWTEKLTEAGELFFVVEPHVPGLGKGGRPRDSAWYGFVHWFLYEFDPKLTGVWRAEIFRDEAGAATGVADTFSEMTLGLIAKPSPWLWVRPEARYDWAQFTHPYHDGTRGSQLTLAFDVVLLF